MAGEAYISTIPRDISWKSSPCLTAAGANVLVAVTGMQREAKLLRRLCDVVVAGSDNSTLASKIEVAIARGVKGILSFGICGALSPGLEIGSVVVGAEVVYRDERRQADEAWTAVLISACDAAAGVVAGSDSI